MISSGTTASILPGVVRTRPNGDKLVAIEMAPGLELQLMSGGENVGYVVCFGYELVVLAWSAQTISCKLIKNDLMCSNMAR